MRTTLICCIAAGTMLALTQGVRAQDKDIKPLDPQEMSYTGCLEAGATADSYKLTGAEMMMPADIKKDGAMTKDTVKQDDMLEMTVMSKDVDLSKHLGHKVTVTGVADKSMIKDSMGKETRSFTVRRLKMVSASCM